MKYLPVIIFICIICLVAAIIIPTITEKQHADKYILMQRRYDSLAVIKDSLNNIVLEFDTLSDRLAIENVIEKEKLVYIQSKNHENIKTINRFNNVQLFEFFANRSYVKTDSSSAWN